MRSLTGVRKKVPALQRTIMSAVSDLGVTHDLAASHIGCSESRVDFWTSTRHRAMTLDDMLGLAEVAGSAEPVLGPVARACGYVLVPEHETEAPAHGSLQSQALNAGMLVGRLQGHVAEAMQDGHLSEQERAELREVVFGLLERLQGLHGELVAPVRAVSSR